MRAHQRDNKSTTLGNQAAIWTWNSKHGRLGSDRHSDAVITNGIKTLGIQISSKVFAVWHEHAMMENKIKCTVSTMSGGK